MPVTVEDHKKLNELIMLANFGRGISANAQYLFTFSSIQDAKNKADIIDQELRNLKQVRTHYLKAHIEQFMTGLNTDNIEEKVNLYRKYAVPTVQKINSIVQFVTGVNTYARAVLTYGQVQNNFYMADKNIVNQLGSNLDYMEKPLKTILVADKVEPVIKRVQDPRTVMSNGGVVLFKENDVEKMKDVILSTDYVLKSLKMA